MKQGPPEGWIERLIRRPIVLTILLFVVALGLRLLALGQFVTPDELIWVYRSVLFREAVANGQWADTVVSGHPGVITTWLGAAAIQLQLFLRTGDRAVYEWLLHMAYLTPDNMEAFRRLYVFLDGARTAVAVVNSLGLVVIFWLLRELFNDRIALVTALILAFDPFLAGLSAILHVDALMTTWSFVALLALALGAGLGRQPQSRRRQILWMALSGAAAALAVLSKTPALLLVPMAGAALLMLIRQEREQPLRARLIHALLLGAVWLGALLVAAFFVYPALWSAPLQAVNTAGSNAGRHATEALRPTFFMGDVSFDHGGLFYPAVLLWRLSPLILGGLILGLAAFLKEPRLPKDRHRSLVLVVLWVLLFLVGISLAAKKFDRYILPVFPALALLAAVVFVRYRRQISAPFIAITALFVLAQAVMLLTSAPYLLSAYNLLVGGPMTAQYVLPLGWGESISAAGQWLSTDEDEEHLSALSGIAPSLAPFYPGQTLFSETAEWQEANRIILTANTQQVDPHAKLEADTTLELLHTIQFGLLPQAWIYDNPHPQPSLIKPEDLAEPVSFGEQMQLTAQQINRKDDEVLFTARWRKEQEAPLLNVKLRLEDANGIAWQGLEEELLNETYFYPQYWQPEESPQKTYRLALPAGTPPGTYTVKLSLVDQFTEGQLPLRDNSGQFAGVEYEAGTVTLDDPIAVADVSQLGMAASQDAVWFDGRLRLLGHGGLPETGTSGGIIPLDLFWQVENDPPAGVQLTVLLDGEEIANLTLTANYSSLQAGDIFRGKYLVPVPADLPGGDYALSVAPTTAGSAQNGPGAAAVGMLHIEAVDRQFVLPDNLELPLFINFEPSIMLRGASPAQIDAGKGEPLAVTLYWQTAARTEEPVTAFIHLIDNNGEIIAQSDQWPGGIPSITWAPDQVIVDEHEIEIPEDIAPGRYRLATGLYVASSGQRLPAADAAGKPLDSNRFVLPIQVSIQE